MSITLPTEKTRARKLPMSPVQRSLLNLRSIWTNDDAGDIGIERLIRLFLAASALLLPGVYFKQIFSRADQRVQDLTTDAYVLIKLFLPLVVLFTGIYSSPLILAVSVILIIETMLYIPLLIFASDFFTKPRSYRRSLLLLFVNYAELVFGYAVLYSQPGTMNNTFDHPVDAIYFSAVTAATIGYGDHFPVTLYGKVIVAIQSMAFLIFGVLFLSFFTARIEHTGYFNDHSTQKSDQIHDNK